MLTALVFALLPAVSGCQDPREPQLEILGSVISDAREIIAGSASTDPSVVALIDDDGTTFCTGTLISPTVVITAGHCLTPSSGRFRVFFGDDARARSNQGYEPAGFFAGTARTHLLPLCESNGN